MAKQDPSPDPEQTETTVSVNDGPAIPLDEFERRTKEAIDNMATGTVEGQQLSFKMWASGRPPSVNGSGPEKVEAATISVSGKIVNGLEGEALRNGRELYMDEGVEVRIIAPGGEVIAAAIGVVESVMVKRQRDDGRTILVREQKVKL